MSDMSSSSMSFSSISSSGTPSASVSSSYIIPDIPNSSSDRDDDVDSLPSISSSILDSEADSSDAQKEWEASLEQLQLLLTMILMPFAGKFLGRKFAYWSRFHPPSRGRRGFVERKAVADPCFSPAGWARYMEWAHNVEIRWTGKAAFNAVGAAEAAASL